MDLELGDFLRKKRALARSGGRRGPGRSSRAEALEELSDRASWSR